MIWTTPPDPMTHHRDFTHQQATFARRFMGSRGGPAFQLILSSDPAWWRQDPELPFTQITMNIQRAAGLAPYVGPPFIWMWDVATDNEGRWIAGPTYKEQPYGFLHQNWMSKYGALWAITLNDIDWRHHDSGREPQE